MSSFEVIAVKVKALEPCVKPSDNIECAVIGDYRSVVGKGDFKPGDIGIYLPEASVLQPWLISKLKLDGKLAGPDKNRIKAVRLRESLSQGILIKLEDHPFLEKKIVKNGDGAIETVDLGQNFAEFLQVTKYEPPVPTHLTGEVIGIGPQNTLKYDIENYKKFPYVLRDGEDVVITEKLHGTFCGIGYVRTLEFPDLQNGNRFAFSKGLGAQGLVFKYNEQNKTNIYNCAMTEFVGPKFAWAWYGSKNEHSGWEGWAEKLQDAERFFVLGEIFGASVQDLNYGLKAPEFRVFDIFLNDRFLNYDEMANLCIKAGVAMVPFLYRGPFSREKLYELTDGKTTINGTHIREGVVVKPSTERNHPEIGRVILKSVSGDYLTRKGDATEFQ